MLCIKEKIFPECIVSVTIPVRNEAEFLEKSLEALSLQTDLQGGKLNPKSFEIIVLTNNCTDNSYEIARKFQAKNSFLNLRLADITTEKHNANSGYVRRLLLEKAFERLSFYHPNDGLILTTDADTQVAANWIAANLFEIETGADAVGGRILFTASEMAKMSLSAKLFHLIDEKYRLLSAELESVLDQLTHDAFPRHHQHFNGSFAVTTRAYRRAGGVPDVRFLEDVAFYHALLRVDAKFRHSPLVKVYTSARETGRTEAGLSTQITDWINLGVRGEDFLVESANTLEQRFFHHGKLRNFRNDLQNQIKPENAAIAKLAEFFELPFEDFRAQLAKPQTFGLLLENIYRLREEKNGLKTDQPLVPIERAVSDLEEKLKIYRKK